MIFRSPRTSSMTKMKPITKRKVATRLVAYDPEMSKNPVRALKNMILTGPKRDLIFYNFLFDFSSK